MMTECPDDDALSRFHDGEFDAALAAHVRSCASCANTLSGLEQVDALLISGLAERPAARIVSFRRWAAVAATVLLAVGLGVLFLALPPAEPDLLSETESGGNRVAAVYGEVTLNEHPALAYDPVEPGESIVTRTGQRAKLDLAPRAELLVNENTRVVIQPDGVTLERGELYAISADGLDIRLPDAAAKLVNGELRVKATDDAVLVAVVKGSGELTTPDGPTSIEAGNEIRWNRRNRKREPRKVDGGPAWTNPLRGILFQDDFTSRAWKLPDARVIEAEGRRALSLVPTAKKRASAMIARPFPVDPGVDVEFDLRRVGDSGAQLWLHIGAGKETRTRMQWTWRGSDERIFRTDKRDVPLWSGKAPSDEGWHRIRLIFTPTEIQLFRDGSLVTHIPHGSGAAERVAVGWHAVGKEIQIRDVIIRRSR